MTPATPRPLTPTMKQTASGRMIDLMAPEPCDIDFGEDIAGTLAVLPRFTGHCRDGRRRVWTVGEHCVAGADILAGHGHKRLALLFLLHDAHEAYLGDIATPVARALAAQADAEWPDKPGHPAGHFITCALRGLKHRLDTAIFAAAGVEPPSPDEKRTIGRMDAAMLVAEARQIMPAPVIPWTHTLGVEPPRMNGGLAPCGLPDKTAAAWLQRLDAWAPMARRKASPEALQPFAAASSSSRVSRGPTPSLTTRQAR